MSKFTHLHLHTQYSILDGASKIDDLFRRTMELGMDAVAITDHGNMYGVMEFYLKAQQYDKIKPIIGVETYVARDTASSKVKPDDRSGYHLILLAQNYIGYKNLIKLVSRSFIEGFYYTPRIDRSWFIGNTEGLIASSACLGGEIPRTILTKGTEAAEKALQFYLDVFGENFYLELQNHGIPEQEYVNRELIAMSKKYGVKLIATNDVHFVMKDDFEAHKLLISINTGKDINDDTLHYTGNEYMKSYEEMLEAFPELPEALANTVSIAESIEKYALKKDVIIPIFKVPEQFEDDDAYLRHLTMEGAAKKYGTLTDEIKERLEYELTVIKNMGFAGYFLIVADLISAAKKNGVLVGPGRGSAVGSAVAYAIDITNIDPIKYGLLFERFLNPERKTMPDIDIDFDDEGRKKVFDYVVEKYGRDKVAQIITFGKLKSKSSVRDVARVMGAELSVADKIAKLVPEGQNVSIDQALIESPELNNIYVNGTEIEKKIIENAKKLEGLIRQTGVHACGTIIGRDVLMNEVPLSIAKDSDLPVIQFEGNLVENAGLLKMDFLGLKTLTIMKNAIEIIEARHGIQIDIDKIPLDDPKTFELFQRGDTVAIFQFESAGMRKWLMELKPTHIEDLIAMNALFRPGPMKFIQTYIHRKHKKVPTEYPHELLEPILKETHGIMVYQEQIMKAAQIIGGFTLGNADNIRKAVSKKKMDEMKKLEIMFIEGAERIHGIPQEQAKQLFNHILEFANYGFNKSHSAAYAVLATQTAWLKAHYPVEFMAAVLTNHEDIKDITFFIEETKRMGIDVLGPDINESYKYFSVTKNGKIRFGLTAIKNVGSAAAEYLISERKQNGPFLNLQDFLKRINTKYVNKRCVEALAYAGAFDSFNIHRAQFFYKEHETAQPFIDNLMRYALNVQNIVSQNHNTLFGDSQEVLLPELKLPNCEPFSQFEQLKYEKEYTGFYIHEHPLAQYSLILKKKCTGNVELVKTALQNESETSLTIAGLVVEAQEKISKLNTKYGILKLEDETGVLELTLFGEQYLKFKHFAEPGIFLFIELKIQKNYKSGKIEIRVQNISQIADIEENIRFAEVHISTDTLDYEYERIISTIQKNKGNIQLKLCVVGKLQDGTKFGANFILTNKKINMNALKIFEKMNGCEIITLK